MAIAMVLAALLLAGLAITIKRRRAEGPNLSWMLAGAGFATLGLAVVISAPVSSDTGMALIIIATCAVAAACLVAWIRNIRSPWTLDDSLDAAVAVTAGLICGWGFQLRPLPAANADLVTYIASGLIVGGMIIAYTSIVTLANPASLPILTATGTALLFTGIATSESSTAHRLRDVTDGNPELWIATGLLSAAALLVLTACSQPRTERAWGPTQYFRNTLVVVCFGLGPIAVIAVEEIATSPEMTGLSIGVGLLSVMVAVRYLRFIRHISRLEATRQARDALFALPFGTLAARSESTLDSMLANVVDLSMRMFHVQRGQLTLMMAPDGSATPVEVDRGLSDTELTVLRTHPRLDPSICLSAAGRYEPIRLRQDDLILPVATKGAWAVVGKSESLCIPITASERVVGLLELWSPGKPLQLGEMDLAAARTFGADSGQSIEHAFLTVRTRTQVEQSDMLLTVSEVFSRGQSLHMCVNQVAERLLGYAGSDRITIGLIERDRGAVYIAADVDRSPNAQTSRQGTRVPLELWKTYQELRRAGHTQVWSRDDPELAPDFRAVMDEFEVGSVLAFPGFLDGRLAVIIQVGARSTVLVDSGEIRAVWKLVARQIQFGIESIAALQESRRSEQTELLRRHINESLQGSVSARHTFRDLGQVFQRVSQVHGATILGWQEERQAFVVESDWAEPPIRVWDVGELIAADRYEVLRNLEAVESMRMWSSTSALVDSSIREQMTRHHVGSMLVLPVRVEDRLLGCLFLVSHHEHGFAAETTELIEQLLPTITLVFEAIEVRRYEAELSREQAFKLALLEAASSRDDAQASLYAVVQAGLGQAGAESIDIAFYDAATERVIIAADSTIPEWPGVEEPGSILPIYPGSIQAQALQTLQPAIWSSSDPDLNTIAQGDRDLYGAHAWLALPLVVEGRPLGLLQILARQPDAFSQRRVRLWTEISHQIAPSVRTLQVSLVNQNLSLQRDLVARINEAAAVSTETSSMWRELVEACLIEGVDAATIFLWHPADKFIEVAYDATIADGPIPIRTGSRFTDVRWDDELSPIRPRPVVNLLVRAADTSPVAEAFLDQFGAGSLALFTLVDKGQVQGLLMLRRQAAIAMPEHVLETGTMLAGNLAPIVRNFRRRMADQRTDAAQSVLITISQAVAGAQDLDTIYDTIVTATHELMGGDSACLFIPGALDQSVRLVASAGTCTVWQAGTSWSNSQAPLDLYAFEPDEWVNVAQADDKRFPMEAGNPFRGEDAAQLVVLPVPMGSRQAGRMVLAAHQPNRFTNELVEIVGAMLLQAGMILEHARATTDEQMVARHRSVLLQVSEATNASDHLDHVLAEITTASLGIANSESCVIELYDSLNDELIVGGISRIDDWVISEQLHGKTRPFASWSIDSALRQDQAIQINSIDDPRISGLMADEMGRFNTQSMIGEALIANGQYIGAYYLFSRVTGSYSERDVWTAREVADRIVGAIQSARALEAERRVAIERERLLQISEAATSSLDATLVLQQIANSTIGLAGAECCHVELIDWEHNEFVTGAYSAVPDWDMAGTHHIGQRSTIGAWSIDKQSVTSNAVIAIGSLDDPRVTDQLREDMLDFGTQSILIIPIWLRDECIGILNLYSRRKHAFTNDQQLLASTLAKQAANALQNARIHGQERLRRRQQEVVVRLSNAATSSLDLITATGMLCREISDLTGIESATVGIYRPDAHGFEITADFTIDGWEDRSSIGTVIPAADFQVLREVLNGADVIKVDLPNAHGQHTEFLENHPDMQTIALLPLWLSDVCIGYIGLFDRRVDAIQDDVLAMLALAAPTIVLALSNALQWRDEQRRAVSRSAIVEVGRIAVSDATVEDKLNAFAHACLQIHRVAATYLVGVNPDDSSLSYLAWVDPERPADRKPRDLNQLDLENLPISTVQDGDVLLLSPADLIWNESGLDQGWTRTPRSVASFPLRTDDRLIGYLVFIAEHAYPLDGEVLNVGREIATQISLTIAAARLLETTRRYASEQSALLAANRSVMSATHQSLRDALAAISHQTMTLIGADGCEIEGMLEGQHATELLAQVKVDDWDWNLTEYGRTLELSDWPTTVRVIESRQPLYLNTNDPRLSKLEQQNLSWYDTRAVLIAPMQLNDHVTGIISFYSRRSDAFSSADVQLAMEFGSLAALAIDRARTHQALSEQATRDGLTGTLNRRALMHHLDHQMAVAERNNDLLSIMIIDMNDFKSVNDTHGHIVGDLVLREIARQIESTLRTSDLIGRYGGDEFLAILPNTDLVDAISLARRLYDTVCSSTITLPNGVVISPSFSVGAATYPLDASNREALIERADRAMYITKNAGVSPGELERSGTGTLSLRGSAN